MKSIIKNNSFIVTGASATGKSTLINEAIRQGYIYLPTHMTRKPRENEINGKDAIFIPEKEFITNFNKGIYLEESLDFAKLKSLGVYYGSPREWLVLLKQYGYCATPVSTQIAKKIRDKTSLLWVHLFCDDDDRYNRLIMRGISEEEAYKRMTSGDSIIMPDSALKVNTSKYTPQEIMEQIGGLSHE